VIGATHARLQAGDTLVTYVLAHFLSPARRGWLRPFLRSHSSFSQPGESEASMMSETRTAYLFHCRCDDLHAVSHDITGRNIPRTTCTEGWQLVKEFELGVNENVPASIMPEPIMRGIRNVGYYIWRG